MHIYKKILAQFNLFTSANTKFVNEGKIASLMNSFKVDEFGHEANLKNSDLGYGWIHYGLVRQQKPKKILCVGSRHGYIPAVLAQACKDNGTGLVDFVDAGYGEDESGGWTGVGYWKTKEGQNAFRKFGLGSFLSLHVMENTKFAKIKAKTKYDYIYIDGDHSLSGVILDFKLFWPMLEKNGYIVFHDICVKGYKPEGLYGVWKFWEMASKKLKSISIEFIGSGLGIIQKKC
jgi:predicted O-methyltransferase YrrM